ncbi:hypothetical protein [Pseudoalteromonas piscicida]|uniref:Uncharacterized protein n=1 Tax=Pseudoalteromonas piscicida TaxID=43662 RepID=A0A2A5JM10_PSEO7|nr:hypothetical protein [Pseudoalteromonas piscicida]PCK30465.1 hypothetical protein CEX98_17745 [Pseudoalteromonas piscicida]
MAWFNANSINIDNNSNVAQIVSGESVANIRPGDGLIVGSFNPVEVNRAYATNQGQFIELTTPWGNATQSQVPAIVIPTSGDFNSAVIALKNANTMVNDNVRAMVDWQTKMGAVQFTDLDGNIQTVKTLREMQSEIDSANPYPWAMRKVEFEARRQQNIEKFAASGFVHFGKHYEGAEQSPINQGLTSWQTQPNKLYIGSAATSSTHKGDSLSPFATVTIAGIATYLAHTGDAVYSVIKLPPAEDGTRTYDSETGVSVRHATPAIAFASETATNKVVTDRVDMWGFELFLREINEDDPFVYANGLIQSRAANICGVATVEDAARPITYFSWYQGDDSSRGRGVNWQAATDAQRIAIASNPNNNIYFDDATGKFYQWCVRGRSFAGAGNGDWAYLESIGYPGAGNNLSFAYPHTLVAPQGNDDTPTPYVSGATLGYNTLFYANYGRKQSYSHNGVMYSRYKQDCYFLVCGTITRLNTGAYHPSFNPFGSAYATDGINLTDRTFWYTATAAIKSRTDAFVNVCQNPNATGSLSTTTSAGGKFPRPDGRFYDAIYASGQGGVCRDMRYSARGLTREDFAEADLAIKSGEYRGREYTTTSKVLDPSAAGSGNHPNKLRKVYPSFVGGENVAVLLLDTLEYPCTLGDVFHLYNKSLGVVFSGKVSNVGDNFIYILLGDKVVSDWTGDEVLLVQTKKLNTSVAGEYTHTEVIGDPAEILLCGDLEDGWVGDWVPEIPDGTVKDFKLNRPTTSTPTILETSDSGVNWSSVTTTWSDLKNLYESKAIANSAIWLVSYSTKAKLTKGSDNVKPYKDCLGVVSILGDNLDGRRSIAYSLTGDILNVRAWLASVERLPLLSLRYRDGTGELNPSGLGLTHTDVSDLLYKADTNYVKVFNYAVESNGLALINYAYRQLKFDTTADDFGDDAKVPLFDNANSSVDDNGNRVLVGTAQIVEPLGWIKNDK